jgi:hypothetical protein
MKVGSELTRQNILEKFNVGYRETTIDNYRNYLKNAGFLETIGRGNYRKIKEIPKMTLTKLKQMAYKNHRLSLSEITKNKTNGNY